jgi:hypothetical protein
MDRKFAALVEHLAPKCAALAAMRPLKYGELRADMPKAGVYMFSTPTEHLYVGRSDDLRGRYGRHCRPGATDRQAAFAFKLARIETGYTEATYVAGEGSRRWLMEQPAFAAAFTNAKALIRTLEYRYVEESDANRQALLEIYCTIVLGAKHNDFQNH